MFRTLPPAFHEPDDLHDLAVEMTAPREDNFATEDEVDDEENFGISAGYTYFGQFIDHDLTFDPASSLQRQNDPDGLVDYRTPRFDLDCLYGRGPDDQPYMYAEDGVHMLLGRPLTGVESDAGTRDLPRNSPTTGEPRALIGDPRNDENVLVSQLHATMLRFHNRVADVLEQRHGRRLRFEWVQREVRFHYQWVVLHDFLPTIVGPDLLETILPGIRTGGPWSEKPNLKRFKWRNVPFIPVEFSVAAYRFGHSMIRPIYRLNTTLLNRQQIFAANPFESLAGFRVFPDSWAVDWELFFDMRKPSPDLGKNRLQRAYKIDTSLVNPLGALPPSITAGIPSLPERNLLRGLRMSLPSGQAVAASMGIPPIPDQDLRIGKATAGAQATNHSLTDISPSFAGNAPLWVYLLAEAQQQFSTDDTPIRLGPVGGQIVAEVFIGLLYGDSHSFLRQNPLWRPFEEFTQDGEFMIADLLREARKA